MLKMWWKLIRKSHASFRYLSTLIKKIQRWKIVYTIYMIWIPKICTVSPAKMDFRETHPQLPVVWCTSNHAWNSECVILLDIMVYHLFSITWSLVIHVFSSITYPSFNSMSINHTRSSDYHCRKKKNYMTISCDV